MFTELYSEPEGPTRREIAAELFLHLCKQEKPDNLEISLYREAIVETAITATDEFLALLAATEEGDKAPEADAVQEG